MNQELKTRWVEALRSGKYEQGIHRLRSGRFVALADDEPQEGPDRFCCLGVLCDISNAGEWNEGFYDVRGQRNSTQLPSILAAELLISDIDQETLMDMNDVYRDSFHEIAQWVEDNL